MDDYISKPVSMEAIVGAIGKWARQPGKLAGAVTGSIGSESPGVVNQVR